MSPEPAKKRSIARNKKAWHDFEILERVEAGLALKGTEVKSLREGRATLTGSFVRLKEEAYLIGSNIPEYTYGNRMNHDPERPRKLLLHRREIRKLYHSVKTGGLTIVPLELYFLGPRVKLEIALVKGKRQHDKRQALAKKEARRDMDRAERQRR